MAEDEMLQDHQSTWRSFTRVATLATAATAVCLALMALFLL